MKSKKRILVILAGGASSRLKKTLKDVDLDKNVSDLAKSSHKTLIPLGKDKRPLIYFILQNALKYAKINLTLYNIQMNIIII